MADIHRRTKPFRYGTHPVFVSAAPGVTANTTVNTLVAIPKTRCWISKATVTLSTIGSDADGTILLRLKAVATDGTTARNISDQLSLESDGVATALVPVALTISATDGNRFLAEGETIRLEVISNSAAIDTAPVGSVALELFVQD